MSELMKKALQESNGKDIKHKILCNVKIFLTNPNVSTHKAIKRVSSLPMRHSNIDVFHVPTS